MHLVLEWTFPARVGPQNVSAKGSPYARSKPFSVSASDVTHKV